MSFLLQVIRDAYVLICLNITSLCQNVRPGMLTQWHENLTSYVEQDRQYTYNITLRRVRSNTVAV